MSNFKLVYVLVSNFRDCFTEQTILSAYSCKQSNPDIKITLVMDEGTFLLYEKYNSQYKVLFNEIKVINVPSIYNQMQISRYLKTSLRQIIYGDFLYLDSDTIVVGDLTSINNPSYDIGAILDNNGGHGNLVWEEYTCRRMNWLECMHETVYNGGVLFVKESEKSNAFFETWHQRWIECVENGLSIDQLALRKSNNDLSHVIAELSGVFNCQICKSESKQFFNDAKIIHYYTCPNDRSYSLLKKPELWLKFKESGEIPELFSKAVCDYRTYCSIRFEEITDSDIIFLESPLHHLYIYHNRICLFIEKMYMMLRKLR